MDLSKIDIAKLTEKANLDHAVDEAFTYGEHRGGCSATGDRYGTMGGPRYDDVLKDYLAEKFGIRGGLEVIASELPKVPRTILAKLREGFDSGYSKESKAMSDADDDSFP